MTQKRRRALTCLVGCRLQMTSLPPRRFVASGSVPLGTICSVVPRQMLRSAALVVLFGYFVCAFVFVPIQHHVITSDDDRLATLSITGNFLRTRSF